MVAAKQGKVQCKIPQSKQTMFNSQRRNMRSNTEHKLYASASTFTKITHTCRSKYSPQWRQAKSRSTNF